MSPSTIGLVFGVAVLSYAVAARPAAALAERLGRLRGAATGLLCSSMALLVVLPETAGGVVVALALVGAASALALAPTLAAMADAIDAAAGATTRPDYASVYPLYNAAYAVGMWAGPVAGSALVEELGLLGGVLVAGIAGASCSLLVLRSARRAR